MLEFNNVTRKFTNDKGISNNSWKINKGEIVGFIGSNGCGKTTTLKIIVGLQIVDGGEVVYLGKRIDTFSSRIFSLVCEQRSIYQDIKVYQQLELVCGLYKVSKEKRKKRIDKWLRTFDLVEYKKSRINELSKGNQQLIQIICGLVNEPEILLLDEPFNGLDEKRVSRLIEVLKEFSKDRIILIAFHQLDLKEVLCDRIIQLQNGEIINSEVFA